MVEVRKNVIRSLTNSQLTGEVLILEMLVICLHVLAAALEKTAGFEIGPELE